MTRAAWVAAVAALALACVATITWAPWSEDKGDGSRWESAYRGLCEAADRAAGGELTSARRAFYDTAHEPLHGLATVVGATDRREAARLLEAKERVESGLATRTEALADQLHVLAEHARHAAARTGDPVSQDCAAGSS